MPDISKSENRIKSLDRMREEQFLFVYGTLRRGVLKAGRLEEVMTQDAEYTGPARAAGRLYWVSSYPGYVMTQGQGEWVSGELYRIVNPDRLFGQLDRYEGCSSEDPQPHEYERIRTEVYEMNGRETEAWVYHYTGDLRGEERILSGDFFQPECLPEQQTSSAVNQNAKEE